MTDPLDDEYAEIRRDARALISPHPRPLRVWVFAAVMVAVLAAILLGAWATRGDERCMTRMADTGATVTVCTPHPIKAPRTEHGS